MRPFLQKFTLILLLSLGLVGFSSSGVTEAPWLFDDFTDGQAEGWLTSGSGSWFVENGAYTVDMGSGTNMEGKSTSGDIQWADYIYEVDVLGVSGADKIITFGHSDNNNFYSLNLRAAPSHDVVLLEGHDGNVAVLTSAPYANSNGNWYHIRAMVQGPTIHIAINNTHLISYLDTNSPTLNGKIGLIGWTGGAGINRVRFDNIAVYPLKVTYIPIIMK